MIRAAVAPDPFSPTANPDTYVPCSTTERALAMLDESLVAGRIAALIGPPGLGKTLLLQLIGRREETRWRSVYVPFCSLSIEELCALALGLLGRPTDGDPRDALERYAIGLGADGAGLLLLIDDAGAMPPETVRRLGRLVERCEGSLHLALATVEGEAGRRTCAALGAQVDVVRLTRGLSAEESRHYVERRLSLAEVPEDVRAAFDPETLDALHQQSQGVPRRLNFAAQDVLRALLQEELPTLADSAPASAPKAILHPPTPTLARPVKPVAEVPEPEPAAGPSVPATRLTAEPPDAVGAYRVVRGRPVDPERRAPVAATPASEPAPREGTEQAQPKGGRSIAELLTRDAITEALTAETAAAAVEASAPAPEALDPSPAYPVAPVDEDPPPRSVGLTIPAEARDAETPVTPAREVRDDPAIPEPQARRSWVRTGGAIAVFAASVAAGIFVFASFERESLPRPTTSPEPPVAVRPIAPEPTAEVPSPEPVRVAPVPGPSPERSTPEPAPEPARTIASPTPTPTPAPETPPVTPAPIAIERAPTPPTPERPTPVAPVAPAPEIAAPVAPPTPAPEIAAPVAPSTPAPEIAAPVAPSTPAPEIATPVAPTTPAPEIAAPVAPSTPAPEIAAPVAPSTPAPEIAAPVTPARPAPEIAAPVAPARPTPEPPVADPSPAPVTPVTPTPGPPEPTVARPAPALAATHAVSVNATPWAIVEVDGRELGETPIAGIELEAGPHTFRATMPDGSVRERTVEIDAVNRFVVFE